MTSYYPSHVGGGYATTQPMYATSAAGYAATPYPVAASYAQPVAASYAQPAMYVPSYRSGSRYHHRRPHRSSYHYSTPAVGVAAPVMMQPGYGYPHHSGYHNPYSFTARLRRFFGLAPKTGVIYKHDRSSWGFMGYSRRPRYTDVRTGGEVDRLGRPVYRV